MKKPNYNEMVNALNYNSDTGIFTWKVSVAHRVKIGSVAGTLNKGNGYRIIMLNGVNYYAHRLAFFYIYEYWPENELDHINKIRDDNRIINLREVSRSCNMRNKKLAKNNTSGIKGVYWDKSRENWAAKIGVFKKLRNLGSYKDYTEAVFARYAGEQALGWKGCEENSPAFKYVHNVLGR